MKRILWISDIHLNGIGTKGNTQRLIKSFIKTLKELREPIELMIISGDIAKSGSEREHYEKFDELIIKPLKKLFPEIQLICVPGNHDVNWENTQEKLVSYVVRNPETPNVLQSFRNKIDKKYFYSIFNNYERFHEDKFINKASETFSNLTIIDNVAVVSLNSAWLSIGAPVNASEIKTRTVNKVQNLSIVSGEGTKVLFEELGNQTYGFTIPEVKKKLDDIYDDLVENHRDKFKILVVHHPPNNWLHWKELYSERESEKSDFHNFIVDTNIDLVLCGHEHTSLVEGGLLYGKSLVLYAGMFLDHHEADYSNSWFKLLEVTDHDTSGQAVLNEKWFHYSNTDGGRWKEKEEFSMQYHGWQRIGRRLNAKESTRNEAREVKLESELTLKKYIAAAAVSPEYEYQLLKLTGFSASSSETITISGLPDNSFKLISDKYNALFIITNIDDFFIEYDEESYKNSYIYWVTQKVIEHNYENIFIFYLYRNVNHKNKNVDGKMLAEVVQSKFEQFRHVIFKLSDVLINLKNANFAVRKME